jgi:hypothetical protein
LRYKSQEEENASNFNRLKLRVKEIINSEPAVVDINADKPIQSYLDIKSKIGDIASQINYKVAYIDISAMTHLWALSVIHSSLTNGFRTAVIYTEARSYFPPKREENKIIKIWRQRQYDEVVRYLQSAGLKSVNILQEFGGNFRPGKPTCLIIFAGYEPNRIEGLVDSYAPGALILLYGRSPHEYMRSRVKFSKELHKDLLSKWSVRETEVSTLYVDEIVTVLEDELRVIQDYYDIAITPQCSKMQGVAIYLFWRRHPEVQIVLTSPVRFNPSRYSRGAKNTYIYEIK